MGIFNKKQNHKNYVNMVHKTAESHMPELANWDFTLTDFVPPASNTLKRLGIYSSKKMFARLMGKHLYTSENPFANATMITCFKDKTIHFLSVGTSPSKSHMEVKSDGCITFKASDTKEVKTSFGKKVIFVLQNGDEFAFKYGLYPSTIYAMLEHDKALEQFIKSLC